MNYALLRDLKRLDSMIPSQAFLWHTCISYNIPLQLGIVVIDVIILNVSFVSLKHHCHFSTESSLVIDMKSADNVYDFGLTSPQDLHIMRFYESKAILQNANLDGNYWVLPKIYILHRKKYSIALILKIKFSKVESINWKIVLLQSQKSNAFICLNNIKNNYKYQWHNMQQWTDWDRCQYGAKIPNPNTLSLGNNWIFQLQDNKQEELKSMEKIQTTENWIPIYI